MLAYAMSGGQAVTGVPGREPNKLGLYAPLFYAGATAATSRSELSWRRRRSGIGERVDLSIQDVLATSMDRAAQNLMSLEYSGALHRTIDAHYRASAFPGGVYGGQLPCKDGYISIMCYPHWWDRFCRMIGRPDLIDDASYVERLQDPDFGPQIDALFLPWVLERTKAEVMQEAQAQGVPVGALHTMADIFENPQLRERAYFTLLDHPEAGRLEYPGPPFKLSKTPAQDPARAAARRAHQRGADRPARLLAARGGDPAAARRGVDRDCRGARPSPAARRRPRALERHGLGGPRSLAAPRGSRRGRDRDRVDPAHEPHRA